MHVIKGFAWNLLFLDVIIAWHDLKPMWEWVFCRLCQKVKGRRNKRWTIAIDHKSLSLSWSWVCLDIWVVIICLSADTLSLLLPETLICLVKIFAFGEILWLADWYICSLVKFDQCKFDTLRVIWSICEAHRLLV